MIDDAERKKRLEIVRRIAIGMAEKNHDPILGKTQILTESTFEGNPTTEEELDKQNPVATQTDGGRYFTHVRMDGRGQLNIKWPSGIEKIIKFWIPEEYLAPDSSVGTPSNPPQAPRKRPASTKASGTDPASKDDALVQMLSAASTIRAYELVQGAEFSREQVGLYLENYQGKYSHKIVEAGMGLLISMRMAKKKSLGARLKGFFGAKELPSKEERMIEECAKRNLTVPGAREEMQRLLSNNFLRDAHEVVLPDDDSLQRSTSAKQKLNALLRRSDDGKSSVGDDLFASIFAPLAEFQVRTIQTEDKPDSDYSSDGVLFELGCYLFTRADVYLFTQHPTIRDKVGAFLHGKLQNLFQDPLNLEPEQFADVANDRLEMYGRLVRDDPKPERVHTTISWAVHDTINNGGSPECDVESRVPRIDALNDFSFKTTLMHWEVEIVPRVHAAIDQVSMQMKQKG